MDLGLAERTALVCASTSGLGLVTAQALCEDGARVVVTSRSSERAEEVAAALPNAIGIGCDLLAADGAARLFGESTKRVGKIDILVLNGPGPAPGTAADVDDAGVDSAVAALVKPQVQLVRWDPLRGKVRARGADNVDDWNRITLDSIRTHCGRHFPVQRVAKATYWDILKRRAGENRIDFIEGVATALTPIAFFETVMVRSYENLVDSDTRVDVNTGIVAASRLQAVIGSRDYSIDIAEMVARIPRRRPDVHEQRAWRVFADRTGIGWTVTGHGFQQWAVRIT